MMTNDGGSNSASSGMAAIGAAAAGDGNTSGGSSGQFIPYNQQAIPSEEDMRQIEHLCSQFFEPDTNEADRRRGMNLDSVFINYV
jgi:hypothetical protein